MKNGSLFDFILYPQKVLDENLTKILFYKIFQAIKKCHDYNICIRDIKLENILLDDNYNPILCDFGFGKISENKITGQVGTYKYMAPEVLLDEPYSGFKVDIFNLGLTLYVSMTGNPIITLEDEEIGKESFGDSYDNRAKLLYDKKYKKFWNNPRSKKNNFSEKLKKLFQKMTLKDPLKRITINDVLKDVWLEDLNNEKIEELEGKLKDEFDKRKDKVINGLNTEREGEKHQTSSLLDNKGIEEECKQYFNRDIDIKPINKDSIRENYVEIKSKSNKFDPYYFMDKLYDEIDNNFGDNYRCKAEEKKKSKKP